MMGVPAPLRVDALLILTRTDCSRFVFSGTQEMKLTISFLYTFFKIVDHRSYTFTISKHNV